MGIDGDIILKAGLDTTGVTSKIEDLKKSISKSLKNLIRIGFGVRSVFTLIRKLRTALFSGFGNLASVYEPFNKAMSEIKTSLNLLKNTFASAFAPIIETVAPILSQFINMVAEAVSQVGQFIAVLTGKEYVRAGTVWVDYAESLNGSTKSTNAQTAATKKQTEAQKKLNREITHFDDLVILHDKDKDNNTTSGAATPDYSFTPTPVGNAIKQFAEDFKAAWKEGDFTDIGRRVGEALKTGLENIDWKGIQEKCNTIASSIATFLNGFLETPGLFTTIGNTVGEAINTALGALNTFAWKFHWGSLGKAISDEIIAICSTINWDLVYSTVRGFATGFADYLNNLFTPETFSAIGTTVGNLISAALLFLNTFGERFDGVKFGASLATGINKALEKIGPLQLIKGIITVITTIRDTLVGFMGTINWYDIGVKLRDIIKNLPWKLLFVSFGVIIWNAINAVVQLFMGLFDTKNISGPITDALNNLKSTVDDIADKVDFEAIAKGFRALVDALKPAGEAFAVGFINMINALLKIGVAGLQKLGPAMQAIADAINTLDPDMVQFVGQGLGMIAAALLGISLLKGVAGIISGLIGPLFGLATGAAAADTALGSAGLLGTLGALAPALAGVAIGMEWGRTEIVSTAEELAPLTEEGKTTLSLLKQLAPQYGLTAEQVSELAWEIEGVIDPTSDFEGCIKLVDKNLRDSGVNVDSFKTSLAHLAEEARNGGKDVSAIDSYISGVKVSSEEADTKTSGLADAFDLFNSLSITTPLKLALLKAAIGGLSESSQLSNEDVSKLQALLDNYNTKPTEDNMDKIVTAFDDAGISANDFIMALTTTMSDLDPATQKEFNKALLSIKNASPDIKKESKETMKNVGIGGKEGIEETADDVIEAVGTMTDDALTEAETEAETGSPSKRTERLGKAIDEGLENGLKSKQATLVDLAGSIISAMLKKMESFKTSFETTGQDLMSSLQDGVDSYSKTLPTTAFNIVDAMKTKANSLNFWNVGKNIAVGIYNGLFAHGEWLKTLAWNTAVNMYNSACDALDIASPSKKFAWIGEMMVTGWGKGVKDNEDIATDAVSNLTDAITDEAEGASADIKLDTAIGSWIDKLDSVLVAFSDKIVNSFDNLVNNLSAISTMSVPMPAVAQGMVIPSSLQAANSNNDNMTRLQEMLDSLTTNQMTVEDLRPLLVEMFTDYMNLGWYIGDEQLARHVKNGNLLLDRRYSIMK